MKSEIVRFAEYEVNPQKQIDDHNKMERIFSFSNDDFGEKLKELMSYKHIGVTTLSERLNINNQDLNKILLNHQRPTLDQFIKISYYFYEDEIAKNIHNLMDKTLLWEFSCEIRDGKYKNLKINSRKK